VWFIGFPKGKLLQPTEEIGATEDAISAGSFAEAGVKVFHDCVGHLWLIGEDLCGKGGLAGGTGKRSFGVDWD